MEKRSYTCIVCPLSCRGELMLSGDEIWDALGFQCKRGVEYAKNEYRDPKRMLTTTVQIQRGLFPNLPVVSDREISKEKLMACLAYLYGIQVEAPVKEGDVIVANILETGVNIVAARNMKRKQ